MNENLHQRAQKLLAESLVEGIAAPIRPGSGSICASAPIVRVKLLPLRISRALRGVPVAVPRDLVAARNSAFACAPRKPANLRAADIFFGSSLVRAGCWCA